MRSSDWWLRLCVWNGQKLNLSLTLSFLSTSIKKETGPTALRTKKQSFSPVKRLSLPSPFPTLNLPLPHSFLIGNKNLYLSYIQIALSSLSLHLYLTSLSFQSFSTPTFCLVFSVLASDLTKPCCYFGSVNLISI